MRIVLFDLFDTLLEKVWFDYDKGLELLANKYFDGLTNMQKNTERALCLIAT